MRNTNIDAIVHKILLLSKINLEDNTDKTNPRKREPQSPINILALGKFRGRKPSVAPKIKAEHRKISNLFNKKDITARQSAWDEETPVAKPSTPSIKLVELVIKIIQIEENTPWIIEIL